MRQKIQLHISIGILVCLWLSGAAYAQDSLKALTYSDYMGLVAKYHPVAKQAALLNDQAKAEIRMARGFFDPKLVATFDRKEFKNKEYFTEFDGGIKVPLWIGELKSGIERNTGQYLSANKTTPAEGLLYAGISVPLGQGLFIDQRRAVLRQAQALQLMNDAERLKVINKLLLSAAKDFWSWYFAYQNYTQIADGYRLADERFQAIRRRASVGEAAVIDTVEAVIALQDRFIQMREAEVELKNSVLMLSTYLWADADIPVELSSTVKPEYNSNDIKVLNDDELTALKTQAKANHPEIKKITYKIKQLEYDRRLAVENFKPVFNVNANLLNTAGSGFSEMNAPYFNNNYKLGAEFAFPIFLRKERGKLGLYKAKISTAEQERFAANREIQNNIEAVWNKMKNLERLLTLQTTLVNNYRTLRDAELARFSIGESTLFLVNSREVKLIESLQKEAKMQAEYRKAYAELLWAAGVLAN